MDQDLCFAFRSGDLVLLRQWRPGKTIPHAEGPYSFVRYTQKLGVTAIIRDTEGTELEVSVANLLPLRTGSWGGSIELFDSDSSSEDE